MYFCNHALLIALKLFRTFKRIDVESGVKQSNKQSSHRRKNLYNDLPAFQLHRVDLCNDDVTEENKDLPVMPHASPFVTKAYCNCGNKQAEREDPFDHQVIF